MVKHIGFIFIDLDVAFSKIMLKNLITIAAINSDISFLLFFSKNVTIKEYERGSNFGRSS